MPSPSPSQSPADACTADGLKFAFRGSVPKWNDCPECRGARNTFDVTATRGGVPIGPESDCGQALIEKYGEFEGIIIEPGNTRSGFEHQGCSLEDYHRIVAAGGDLKKECRSADPTGDFFIFAHATNSDGNPDHWRGKRYLAGGEADFCVSWKHLDHYRCQRCFTDDRGAITRSATCGTNAAGRDLLK